MKTKMLTVTQAAERLEMYTQTIRRLCRNGHLTGAQQVTDPFGKEYWLIPESTIEEWKPRSKGRPAGEAPATSRERIRRAVANKRKAAKRRAAAGVIAAAKNPVTDGYEKRVKS